MMIMMTMHSILPYCATASLFSPSSMAVLLEIDDEAPASGSKCAPITVGCANPNPIDAPCLDEEVERRPVTELTPLAPPKRGEEELCMETDAEEPEPSSPRPRGMPGEKGRRGGG